MQKNARLFHVQGEEQAYNTRVREPLGRNVKLKFTVNHNKNLVQAGGWAGSQVTF